jgi:hypothetical protein
MPQLPDGLRPSRDPRDEPGTDDHDRLIHPHGNALWFPWPYAVDDFPSYRRACETAHRALSADYLVHAAREPLPLLCRLPHGEILTDGVNELPHSMRELCTAALAAVEQTTGKRYGLLRVWRHFGDCDVAEAWRCSGEVHP